MLTFGHQSARVMWLQQRLTDLGYRPGPVNGVFNGDTASAVLAFQKREGLGRDGVAGPMVQAAITTPKGAGPQAGLPTPRIEIDIVRQIAFVVLAGKPVITLNVSTGSGMHYQDPQTKAIDVAYTPVGSFTVLRKIDKDVQAPLGLLHRPMYFYGGWAIHGSASVPGWPASHGCVRVSDNDADWLFPQIPVGTAVIIYDSTGKSPAVAPTGAAPGS
jgi:lipoprotein-anchoring transpeptidase ErfK/SrfK